MNWVKANWLIIVLSVVALAALPSMYFVSSGMSKKLRAQVQKDVEAAHRDVANSQVTYTIPDVKQPDKKVFEKSTDVNDILTKRIGEQRAAIKGEASLLGAEAVKFNEGTHRPLIEGLFPSPRPADRNRAIYQFAREYIERMPKAMLDAVNARGPVDPVRLASDLAEYKRSREERLMAMGSVVDPAEVQKLGEELLAQRLDRYRAWGSQTSFYADVSIYGDIPTAVPSQAMPPMSELWNWQMKLWGYEDLFKAFALANSLGVDGGGASVLTGPVKRIIKISVLGKDYLDAPDDVPVDPAEAVLVAEKKDPVTPDMAESLTGRYSGPSTGNRYYDLRTATVEMVVAPEKLPYLFEALARTNYMTVLKCDMEPMDAVEDLASGYFYGNDHVVRAVMTIEIVWLRDWTKKYMPPTVRRALGVADDVPAEPGADGAEVPPPQ